MATTRTGAVLRQIDELFGAGTLAGLSDAQLLDRFRTQRDEAAFEALVARHGGMVLSVCRGVLRDRSDAEDAFQATFLVLVRKADSLRVEGTLGGWLHRVATRVAIQANASAVRRRVRERKVGEAAAQEMVLCRDEADELKAVLHAEIGRLPDRLRLPVILCDLEGKTRAQAASELRWSEGTVRGRLARGRERLRSRMVRHGLAVTAGSLAATLAEASGSVLPEACAAETVRMAMGTLGGQGVGGSVALLVVQVLRSMGLARLKGIAAMLVSALAVAGGATGFLAVGAQERPAQVPPDSPKMTPPAQGKVAMPGDGKKASTDRPPTSPISKLGDFLRSLRGEKEFRYQGVVVDPGGKPVAGAKIFLMYGPQPNQPMATTGSDGRFQFASRGPDQLKDARVIAEAAGFAPGAASEGFLLSRYPNTDPSDAGRELTVRMMPDQPIEGRVVDLEGRPVAGAKIQVPFLFAPPKGDLSPWLEAMKSREGPVDNLKFRYLGRVSLQDVRPVAAVATDAQGRFTLRGLGRDRLADVHIEGPGICTLEVKMLTRPGEPFQALNHPQLPEFGSTTFYGASPRLVATPSRPIEGIVRDKQTGKPIAGAIIHSTKLADRDLWNNQVAQTKSDAQGRYRLLGMPRGAGNVIVVGTSPVQGYLPAQIEVGDSPGLGAITLDVDLPKGVDIQGQIRDRQTGKPVSAWVVYHAAKENPNLDSAPGFRANMFGDGPLLRIDAPPDGRFRIAGLPGKGALVIQTKDGRYPGDGSSDLPRFDFIPSIQGFSTSATVMVDIPVGATTFSRDIVLDYGRTLDGTVLDPEGKPLSEAQVYGLQNLGSWETLKDAAFQVVALQLATKKESDKQHSGRTLVFLHAADKLAGSVSLRGDEAGPIRVKLEPWATALGQIVDPEGKPRANVTLQIRVKRPRLGGGSIDHEPARIRTDAAGRFRIEGLAPALPYQIDVQAPPKQRADRRIAIAPTASGETRDLGTIAIAFLGE